MNYAFLCEIAQVIMGQSPPSSTYNTVGLGLPFFQGKSDFGDLYPTPRVFCSKPNRISQPGDILITVRAPVGPTNINLERSCIGRGLAAIRCGQNIDRNYLLYFLRYYEPKLASVGKGSTFDAISRIDLESLKVPNPPLEEQHRIADLLIRADRLRRLRRTARQLGDSFLQSVFLEMFGDPFTNSKNWTTVKFNDACETRLGKMLDEKQQTGKQLRPYLRNINVQWGAIDLSDVAQMDFNERERKEFRLRNGDLLICEGGEVGRSAVWKDDMPECYFQKALHRARPNPKLANSEYVLWLMWWLAKTGGLGDFTSQVTIAHLTGEKLKELIIPLPPIHLQDKFAMVAHQHDRLRTQQREAERQAEELFQSLLARTFDSNRPPSVPPFSAENGGMKGGQA